MIADMVTALVGWFLELAVRLLAVALGLGVWLGRVAMYLAAIGGLIFAAFSPESSWLASIAGGFVLALVGLLFAYISARLLVGLLILIDTADHFTMARFLPPMYGPGSRHWEEWENERNEITRRDKAALALQAAIGFQF